MKNAINILGLLFLLVLFSCKKNALEKQDEPAKESKAFTVKSGYLQFKSYPDFVNTMISLSLLTSDERRKWESSIGFKSLLSYGEDFNNKMEEADNLKSIELYNKAKDEYSFAVKWIGDTLYKLNAPSILEAKLIDKNGILKIGDDFILYTNGSHVNIGNVAYDEILANRNKYKRTIYEEKNKTSRTMWYLPGLIHANAPTINSYSVSALEWNTVQNTGKFYSRLKLFNLNSTSSGNRLFMTVEYYAMHKNWLGTWRVVSSLVDNIDKPLSLKFSNGTTEDVVYNHTPTSWASQDSYNENIILISSYLKNNSLINHPLSSYSSKFSTAVKEINDDAVSSAGGYCSVVRTDPNIGLQDFLTLYASSLGNGPFPGFHTYTVILNQFQQ